MAKINGNEISPGKTLEFDGGLWMAVKTQKVKPGKGGAYNQVELKNILNGTKLNQRFRSDEAVDEGGSVNGHMTTVDQGADDRLTMADGVETGCGSTVMRLIQR